MNQQNSEQQKASEEYLKKLMPEVSSLKLTAEGYKTRRNLFFSSCFSILYCLSNGLAGSLFGLSLDNLPDFYVSIIILIIIIYLVLLHFFNFRMSVDLARMNFTYPEMEIEQNFMYLQKKTKFEDTSEKTINTWFKNFIKNNINISRLDEEANDKISRIEDSMIEMQDRLKAFEVYLKNYNKWSLFKFYVFDFILPILCASFAMGMLIMKILNS